MVYIHYQIENSGSMDIKIKLLKYPKIEHFKDAMHFLPQCFPLLHVQKVP